jgi:indole-3-glycerol phosphate synthase
VIANDFVLYAYQLFKAKSSGADAIKLHASILPPTEISYMAKIAKKINLSVVVVVSSVPQLLAVLDKVPELENLSVSSRNMQLWKLAPGKARKILDNEEVRLALAAKRTMALANDEDNQAAGASSAGLTVMMEGLSTPAEIVQAREDPLVDGVFLGEELVSSRLPIHEAVKAVL